MGSKSYLFIFIMIAMFLLTASEYVYIRQNPGKSYSEILMERFAETRSMLVDTVRHYSASNSNEKLR